MCVHFSPYAGAIVHLAVVNSKCQFSNDATWPYGQIPKRCVEHWVETRFFFCPCDISTWNLMLGAFGLNLQREDGFETHDTTFKKWRRGGPFTVSRIHRLYFVRFQHGVRYSKRRKRGEGNCLWGLTSQFDSGYERRCNVV